MNNTELFVVEDEHGKILDSSGDGGFSVWLSRAEAQDALDTDTYYSQNTGRVVRFVREDVKAGGRP